MSVDTSTHGLVVLGFRIMTGPTDTDPSATSGSDDPGYYEALGRAIRVLRTERGLERKDLAEAAGLSYPYLSEIETGRKRPSSKALFVIAEALGVRPSELLALGDRYGGRTASGRPAAIVSGAAAVLQPHGPVVVPAEAAPPPPMASLAPPDHSAGTSGGVRWFERTPPRMETSMRAAGASAPGDLARDQARHRLLEQLGEAAAELSDEDLAALLDLARRLAR
jgi:transcriptional regulator with XRE-family HTH domain